MALQEWALPQLSTLLPLETEDLKQILTYTETLSDEEAAAHLKNLLGESPAASDFIMTFREYRSGVSDGPSKQIGSEKAGLSAPPSSPPTQKGMPPTSNMDSKQANNSNNVGSSNGSSSENPPAYQPPPFAPPSTSAPRDGASRASARNHTNKVIEAAKVRARDEQDMQNMLQNLQYQYRIYNSEIEPEHETEYWCSCPIHNYQRRKWDRLPVQRMWSEAVMYPGEKAYSNSPGPSIFGNQQTTSIFSSNPYQMRVVSPYGWYKSSWYQQTPKPDYHAQFIHQTISLNNDLNRKAQIAIDAKEPKVSIWADDEELSNAVSTMALGDKKAPVEKASAVRSPSVAESTPSSSNTEKPAKASKLTSFRKSLGIKSSEERAVTKVEKIVGETKGLRDTILAEERGRWPDDQWRYIVEVYQEKVGMTKKIADLRARCPLQYLHLLRAGYFEPIPVAWANQASNPLKFSIEAADGWRGITPAWRGYEDTAEERLYWVLNHREGSVGMRMKPDMISELNMARDRMARAVEPPPQYYSATDTCHTQHTSEGYSRQVMPPPFQAYDRPEQATDDTMILLDVSGSMDFDPLRPIYNQYLITGYGKSTQPKNKDVAKAIIRRFTDAMANHDHQFQGYDLTTFSSKANYIGTINHANLDTMWRNVRLGGGTRVMTGWQKIKELHFAKHSESATHHPVYGWQAGPQTPMLRLLLLLDGEATDMDEFELDLLGLSWAHVTIFLIGVDGCPHHHRHANELQRISDVNHHVSFVDAQGNTPERYVTHELLKRHLGYEVSMQEFEELEQLPAYSE